MKLYLYKAAAAPVILLLTLAACGGGGGSNDIPITSGVGTTDGPIVTDTGDTTVEIDDGGGVNVDEVVVDADQPFTVSGITFEPDGQNLSFDVDGTRVTFEPDGTSINLEIDPNSSATWAQGTLSANFPTIQINGITPGDARIPGEVVSNPGEVAFLYGGEQSFNPTCSGIELIGNGSLVGVDTNNLDNLEVEVALVNAFATLWAGKIFPCLSQSFEQAAGLSDIEIAIPRVECFFSEVTFRDVCTVSFDNSDNTLLCSSQPSSEFQVLGNLAPFVFTTIVNFVEVCVGMNIPVPAPGPAI